MSQAESPGGPAPGQVTPVQLCDAIEQRVRPATFPVAIRFAGSGEPDPPKLRRPFRDLKIQITICQGISLARRYGWTVGLGAQDLSCPIAAVAFGFEPEVDWYSEGHLAAGMYTGSLAAGALTETAVPKLELGGAEAVWLAPLRRAAFEPDTVLVYGNSAQVMVLVAAALYRRGGSLTSSFTARADCADIAIQPLRSGRPEVILPCYGDRVFGQTQDDEMAFAFPYSWAEEIMTGLEGTYRGGVRYPIPHYLRYAPGFPETYERLRQLWREGAGRSAADEGKAGAGGAGRRPPGQAVTSEK